MIQERLQAVATWMKRVATEPQGELTRWQLAGRFTYDLGRFGARQLRRDRAPQMAAALAFRSLFGLVPVTVVATVAMRALAGPEEFKRAVTNLLTWLNLYHIRPNVEAISGPGIDVMSFGEWLEGLIAQAPKINLTAIGWVGVVIVVYSAVGLMVTIENAFNTIYRAPEGRSWLRRLPMYWFVLTVGPVLMGATLYVERVVSDLVASLDTWQWALQSMTLFWSFLLTWLLMFVIYSMVPNTAVSKRAALIGSLVCAILVEIGKRSMGAYVGNALSIQHLYGSLGLIPLFMFWVYLMWLVVLFGLEVSATLQMLGGRRLEELEAKQRESGMVDPVAVLPVMGFIASQFDKGASVTARQVSEEAGVAEPIVLRLLDHFERAGLVHKLARVEGAFALAQPPDQITADRLLDVGYELVEESAMPRLAIVDQIREAQRAVAARTTLAALQAPFQTSD